MPPKRNDFPQVSTREHFEWYGALDEDDHDETDYSVVNGSNLPGSGGGDAPDQLVVFVHGWLNTPETALDGFETVARALATNGYHQPVVGFSWDSYNYSWWVAKHVARANGPKLANFVDTYGERNPDTEVVLVGHSLGARVVVETLQALETRFEAPDAVGHVALLGGTLRAKDVAADGAFGRVIASFGGDAFAFENYYSGNDEVLDWAFHYAEGGHPAVGRVGCEGTAPEQYTDHDVTGAVSGHSWYTDPDHGCMDEVVTAIGG